MEVRATFYNGLDLSKFSEIFVQQYITRQCQNRVRITFKYLSFARKAYYLTGRKRHNLPCIEVLNFSFFWFILDYKKNPIPADNFKKYRIKHNPKIGFLKPRIRIKTR